MSARQLFLLHNGFLSLALWGQLCLQGLFLMPLETKHTATIINHHINGGHLCHSAITKEHNWKCLWRYKTAQWDIRDWAVLKNAIKLQILAFTLNACSDKITKKKVKLSATVEIRVSNAGHNATFISELRPMLTQHQHQTLHSYTKTLQYWCSSNNLIHLPRLTAMPTTNRGLRLHTRVPYQGLLIKSTPPYSKCWVPNTKEHALKTYSLLWHGG